MYDATNCSVQTYNEEEEEKTEYGQEELQEVSWTLLTCVWYLICYKQDLNNLIVYCRSKHIRPWNWEEQLKMSVCSMFSFSESTALSRCKDTNGSVCLSIVFHCD